MDTKTPFDLAKSVGYRFLRGAVAGAVANMAVLAVFAGSSLDEVKAWLFMLTIAGITGFVGGGILALDKYFRSS